MTLVEQLKDRRGLQHALFITSKQRGAEHAWKRPAICTKLSPRFPTHPKTVSASTWYSSKAISSAFIDIIGDR
jgi:hypothetical protein